MKAYYNDVDPFCCKVLRKQISLGNLPPGDVDERDIRDVTADELKGYGHVHLFAGIGGFPLGFMRAGVPDDWRIVTGGFPCQDISNAGKRVGIEGRRSGLWSEFARVVREIRPSVVVVENVAALLGCNGGGLGRVLGDLARIGFDAEWSVLPACSLGAPHSRERVFLVANADKIGWRRGRDTLHHHPRSSHWKAAEGKCKWSDMERWIRETFSNCYGEAPTSDFQRVDEWFPDRLDRIGACGNAVVPQIAEWLGRRIVTSLSPATTAGGEL